MISAILVSLLFAVTGWLMYFKPKVDDYIVQKASAFEAGTVVFKTQNSKCPSGWEVLGKVTMISHPDSRANFANYFKHRDTHRGWDVFDPIVCVKK